MSVSGAHKLRFLLIACVAGCLSVLSGGSIAQEKKPQQILFKNVNVFDGFSDKLKKNMSVLVEGNVIKKVEKSIKAPGAFVVDGGGRTMTPGLIDMHTHIVFMVPEGTNA